MSLVPLTLACVLSASNVMNIPPQAILTILSVEGGTVGNVSTNTNDSVDLGPMQINNKVWVPVVADMHFNGNQDKAYTMIKNNGCYNVFIGTWILREAIKDANGDVMKGVGWYHSRTPKHTVRYQGKFKEHFNRLFRKQ